MIDALNNEYVEIGKFHALIDHIIPFKIWFERKTTWDNFQKLQYKDKEIIFLRWKWGLSNPEINNSLEEGRKSLMFQIKDMEFGKVDEGLAYYVQTLKDFEILCWKTKKEIGLIKPTDDELSGDVKEVRAMFGGEVV